MKRLLAATAIALASSLSACASFDIDLRSARIVYEPYESLFDSREKQRAPEVLFRIDFTTTFDFEAHGETTGYLLPCGMMRSHLGSPISGVEYAMSFILPRYDGPKKPDQVFTARFTEGNFERFFSVTPPNKAPEDGVWSVRVEDAAKTQGVCFYVSSGATLLNSFTSPDLRIDGILQKTLSPPQADEKKK